MPDSDPGLMTIFAEALEHHAPADREAYLDRACKGNAALRARVEELLAAYAGAGRFLEPGPSPAPDPANPTGSFKSSESGVGQATADHGSAGATGTFGNASPVGDTAPRSANELVILGYEILDELGRGGMGVVYKATQAGLNRPVALKVLVAGPFAGPALRARFLLEAESVAALEHPHVVRVFAFGESGGHPYLVMEFVPGGTLGQRIKTTGPLPAKEATDLLTKLAGAVAHAHSRGVVHRDIKPANVLLTSDGEPRLTDFGLAKVGRTDRDLSVTGQVLGTPAYMAPEQAAGKVHEVGTAADVYALGAVLYDTLTGRPPFQGDSAAVTLQKVLTEEPERPRKLNAMIPRDLETICLKCLEKDPARRYSTAQSLADDLTRYLRNEPISVRPAGVLERGYKWVKRNKALSGAVTAVTLALLIGTGVSFAFGIQANENANEARRKQKQADDAADREREETQRADREKAEALLARNDLKKANDDLNGALAKALLGPISAERPYSPLTDYEVESLRELAARRSTLINRRFLEEATRTPLAAKQLACRAEFALHAVIGLNPDTRNQAEQLLLSQLNAPITQPEQRLDLAIAVANWGPVSHSLATETAHILIDAMTKTEDQSVLRQLAWKLDAVTQRLTPAQLIPVARFIAETLKKTSDDTAIQLLAGCLIEVAQRLTPEAAAQVLADAMVATKHSIARGRLTVGVAAVVHGLTPERAATVCGVAAKLLTDDMTKTTDPGALSELVWGLEAVALHLRPEQAAATLQVLTDTVIKTTDGNVLPRLTSGLVAVAQQLPPERVARVLTDAMTRITDPYALGVLAESVAAIALRLPPDRAAASRASAAERLTDVARKTTDPHALGALARGFVAVAPRLSAEPAAPVVTSFIDAMTKITDSRALGELVWRLGEVARGLTPEQVARVVKVLTDAMTKTTDELVLSPLRDGLVAAAPYLTPEQAASTAQALAEAMNKNPDPVTRRALAGGWVAVAERLSPDQAARAVEFLTDAMTRNIYPSAQGELANGLGVVLKRLSAKQAAPAIKQLTDAMIRTTDTFVLCSLALGLTALAEHLSPEQAVQAIQGLIAARIIPPTSPDVLVGGLAAVFPRLSAEQVAPALKLLTDAIGKTTEPGAVGALARGVVALAPRLSATQAAPAIEVLTNAMMRIPDPNASGPLASAVAALSGRLSPEQASQCLTTAMTRTTEPYALRPLAEGIAALALRLRPEAAAATCETAVKVLATAMNKVTYAYDLHTLAEGVAALAPRLSREAAAGMCGTAAKVLTTAMTKNTYPLHLSSLAAGIIALAPYLTPEEVARTAQTLTDAIYRAQPTYGQGQPAKDLRSLVFGLTRDATTDDIDSPVLLARAAGAFATPYNLLPSLPLLPPHFRPQPRLLPPQMLVDLLKNPFCVGKVRRVVLDALEFTYKRTFADQWEFVEYAQKHHPELDLLTPPKRPELKP